MIAGFSMVSFGLTKRWTLVRRFATFGKAADDGHLFYFGRKEIKNLRREPLRKGYSLGPQEPADRPTHF
jgi:hypothetical protein